MKVRYREVDSSVLQNCPAEVDMDTGVISINKDVWDDYDEFEQSFVIAHEVGHYELQTDSEIEADRYALKQVYRTAPKSLKRSIQTLYKVGIIDTRRMMALYTAALQLDAADGNQLAAIELQNIQQPQQIQNTTMKKQGFIKSNTRTRRADGGNATESREKRGHSINGATVAGMYFSFTNILLIIIAVLLVVLIKKGR